MELTTLGPYRIMGMLGHGGMGAVYRAVDEETDEPAAVKILSASMSKHVDFRHRFEAEIETLKKLRHPNIVRLFGFGEQDGLLFYAMELVDGSSLEQELQRGRLFTWRETAQIGVETCRALRHAHDRGVIHRDIKPANLLMTGDGHVKLSDFGIARLFGTPGLTAAGNVLGTVEFMAPEQADGRPVGPRTDLYSLGAVFFTLLTGAPPFRGSTPLKVLEKQRSARPELVRRYAPAVPSELESIIDELLEKDPQDRIANASLLSRRLEAMLHALAHVPDEREGDVSRTVVDSLDSGSGSGASAAEAPECLDQTKTSDEIPALPPTSDGPPVDADEMAETRATSAFQGYVAADSPRGDVSAVPVAREPTVVVEGQKSADHFTPVAEEELDQTEAEGQLPRPLISVQTWVLAAALIVLGLTAWYLLRPLSEKKLYERIDRITADQKISSLVEAESDIQEFLGRFPHHPESATLREYQRRIDFYRLERDIQLRLRSPKGLLGEDDEEDGAREGVRLIDRAFVEATRLSRDDPERSIEILEAILDLYRDKAKSPPIGLRLEMVEHRVEKLQQQLETWREEDLRWLMARLKTADGLGRSESAAERQKANRIRRGVIALYGDKLWAQEAVRQAREALAAEDDSS